MAYAWLGRTCRGASTEMNGISKSLLRIALVSIGGCSLLPSSDFEKATRVADFAIQAGKFSSEVRLPEGEARLVWAVPNVLCTPLSPATSIAIRIEREGTLVFGQVLKGGDLTWAHGQKSCHGYGYMYDESTGTSGLKLPVPRGGGTYRIELEIASDLSPVARNSSLWFIYGGRAPTIRMFGPE